MQVSLVALRKFKLSGRVFSFPLLVRCLVPRKLTRGFSGFISDNKSGFLSEKDFLDAHAPSAAAATAPPPVSTIIRDFPLPPSQASSKSYQPLRLGIQLSKYGLNLTKMAADGELEKVIGRDEEIQQTIQILSRRRKNNPCLVGEPGVGG
jgi:hypothetical protein